MVFLRHVFLGVLEARERTTGVRMGRRQVRSGRGRPARVHASHQASQRAHTQHQQRPAQVRARSSTQTQIVHCIHCPFSHGKWKRYNIKI